MKFAVGEFAIYRERSGREMRLGQICDGFAIDRRTGTLGGDAPGWYVTHIATGFACHKPFERETQAVAYVRELTAASPKNFWNDRRWSFGVVPSKRSKLWKDADKYDSLAMKKIGMKK